MGSPVSGPQPWTFRIIPRDLFDVLRENGLITVDAVDGVIVDVDRLQMLNDGRVRFRFEAESFNPDFMLDPALRDMPTHRLDLRGLEQLPMTQVAP